MSANVIESGTANALSARVAEEIRSWLGRRMLSQAELARRLGVSKMWVSYRLSGAQPIDLNDLDRIADALGVTVVDLIPRDRREVTSPYLPIPGSRHPVDNRPAAGRPPNGPGRTARRFR